MMPFSVLRVWTTGLLSWLLLGLAVYCLWEWADGEHPPVTEAVIDDRTESVDQPPADARSAPAEVNQEVVVAEGDSQGGWPYLAAGLGLLAFSLGGFLPITMLLGRPGWSERKWEPEGQAKTIDRPDGSQLHVEFLGRSEGPTLVCTHGWSLDHAAWDELKQRLASKFRVVTWDLPGLGRSKGPTNADYRMEKMASDLEAVVQAAGDGPIILVGHSIGGMLNQTFCRLFPEQLGSRVRGIVLLHTTYTNPLHTALGASILKAIEKPIIVPLNYLMIGLWPLAWLSNWQSYLNGTTHLFTRFASFTGQQTWGQLNDAALMAAKASPAVVARGNLAMLTFDEQAKMREVEIPVLVIAGRHDRMTKPEGSDRLSQLLPHALETSIEGNHLGFWERPNEVAEMVTQFANQYGRPAAAGSNPEKVQAGQQPG